MRHVWIAPLALAALAAPALAQDAVDPAAKDFIAKSRAAIRKVSDFSCTIEQRMTEPGKDDTYKGNVLLTIEREDTYGVGTIKKFRITSASGSAWAFDGKNAAMIDAAKKNFATVEAEEPEQVHPVADAFNLVPAWILRDSLMSPTVKLTAAKMLPDATINGVNCHVVEYALEQPNSIQKAGEEPEPDAPKMILRQIRHIGADDLLPRKLESWTKWEGKVPETAKPRSYSGTFTNVKANAHPESDAFTLKQPPGFAKIDRPYPPDLGVPSDDLRFVAGDKAPDFALKTPEGKEVTLASLKGRVVLLDFWATWCGPCKMAMPHVQAVHEKYKDKAVSVFGIDTWERAGPDAPRKYMDEQKFTYGLLMNGDDLAKAYGITGIPTFVVIAPNGTVSYTHVGFDQGGEEALSKIIDKALGGAQ